MFDRTKNLRLSVIKQMEIMATQFPDTISLAQGVPGFDTPECIKRRVEKALQEKVVAKYSLSPGIPELRELIEIKLARDNMFYDWEKEIIVTAGSIEGITATILTITNPGDEIIVPDPTYTSYREVILLSGCQPVFVSLNEQKGWAFELKKFEEAITSRTKAIFYCNPNNPTGTTYSREQLLSLAELARKHNLFLLSDEVYKDFISPPRSERIFSLAEIPELRKRVIRFFSFSKSYAMTGWRVGYLHSDESVIREIIKVHDSLVTCAPVISQYAAMGALEMAQKEVINFNKEYAEKRDFVYQKFDEMKNFFSYIKPQSAYYIFPKIIKKEISMGFPEEKSFSWRFSKWILEETHVAVVPGIAFGENGEDHIRINFGRNQKGLEEALKRIKKFLQKQKLV
ncbi:MAG: hypothetical protein COT31_00505 [Candidatus Moranbacteria bacterium CG08_land_8_20_14_0_20_34_16]|nr:MAG: hypothetical protein COT31_00505 [Candidatus Moranbacteria bacterium CG08_land_8_20_14_0_20_34_16]